MANGKKFSLEPGGDTWRWAAWGGEVVSISISSELKARFGCRGVAMEEAAGDALDEDLCSHRGDFRHRGTLLVPIRGPPSVGQQYDGAADCKCR